MDDVHPGDILSRYPVSRHRLTVRDYYRMAEVGILGWDDRVELLEGQVVDLAPAGPRHALAIDALNEILVLACASRARARVQQPIELDEYSEPEPDVALVRRPWDGYPDSHPHAPDVLLLIEVADSSLAFDRGAKLELYARAGISEYWIVDLTSNRVLTHREPQDGGYASVAVLDMSGTLQIAALPGVTIPVAQIFV
jgi:Uma2 family endonuclease